MGFREFIEMAREAGDLVVIDTPVSVEFEMANVANALSPKVVMFTNITEHPGWRVCANPCADRTYFAMDFGIEADALIPTMTQALAEPTKPAVSTQKPAPCQEVVIEKPNMMDVPFLFHLPSDAGHYCASNVVITHDPELGRNMCYHRLLRVSETEIAARIVERRGTHTAMSKVDGDLPVAICIGVSLATHLAGSMSPPPDVDELAVANALQETPLVKCLTNELHVPADAEIVLEGRITSRRHSEGPFMDLTETMDIVRDEPVIEIDVITHRRDPIFHALLPGGLEHKTLMGMPKEPTIFQAVNEVVECTDVLITPGGASWLHAVVQINKQTEGDGRSAIEAAFKGHGSLKHVWVVDTDVDISDPMQVEWAVATRFQADKDLLIFENQRGSSLDPSGLHVPGEKSRTAKMGLDCTIPLDKPKEKFLRGQYGAVDLDQYLP